MSGAPAWLLSLVRAACCSGAVLVLAAAPGRAFAGDDELGSLEDDKPPTEAPAADPDAESPAEGTEGAPAPPVEAAAPPGPRVLVRPYAGAGFGMRGFSRPTAVGEQTLPGRLVPAAEVGLDVIAWPEDDFSLAFQLHYQSLVWFTVTERPPFALPNYVDVRSERIELSVTPGWRVGPARLEVPIGATIRTFWPNVHTLMTPGYSLVGPHAHIMLTARIAGPVSVRFGPEVQWIMLIDDSLTSTGVDSQGFAIGGEVMVAVELSSTWSLGLNYRESHALVGSTPPSTTPSALTTHVVFEDIERFLTLRITGTF